MTDADLSFLAGALPAPLRQDRIVAIVDGAPGMVRTAALAASLGTSEVTVRQDLAVLDQEARIRRVHGGAVRLGAGSTERPFEETAVEHQVAKAAIGRAAAALVRPGECVVLDVGTTPAAVAEALVARTELTGVTVVTNSLTTALALERAVPRFTVIVTGGTLRPLQHSLVAPFNGAVRLGAGSGERPFEETAVEHQVAKAAIGRAAAALVRSGQCVVLDVGTTPAAVAEALVARADLVDLTVVTNSLTTALALERAVPRFTVVVTGGTLRPLQHSLVAPFNNTLLPLIAADVVFLGGTGVDVEHGLTNVNLPETEAKRMLAATARRTVVVADGSKFGRAHIGVVRALEDIDVVVTAEADAAAVATIRAAGAQVIVADGEQHTEPAGRKNTP